MFQAQDDNTFWPNPSVQVTRNLHSGIILDREIELEALDHVEDELATAIKPPALTIARTGGASDFGYVEIRQVQFAGGFDDAVESARLDY